VAIISSAYAVVWDKRGAERAVRTGGTRPCERAGCKGLRVYVRWPDKHITEPCTAALVRRPDGAWQIV